MRFLRLHPDILSGIVDAGVRRWDGHTRRGTGRGCRGRAHPCGCLPTLVGSRGGATGGGRLLPRGGPARCSQWSGDRVRLRPGVLRPDLVVVERVDRARGVGRARAAAGVLARRVGGGDGTGSVLAVRAGLGGRALDHGRGRPVDRPLGWPAVGTAGLHGRGHSLGRLARPGGRGRDQRRGGPGRRRSGRNSRGRP